MLESACDGTTVSLSHKSIVFCLGGSFDRALEDDSTILERNNGLVRVISVNVGSKAETTEHIRAQHRPHLAQGLLRQVDQV